MKNAMKQPNPYGRPNRHEYGRLMYNGKELESGTWAILQYRRRLLMQDPTIDKRKLKITY